MTGPAIAAQKGRDKSSLSIGFENSRAQIERIVNPADNVVTMRR
jgi:hypothetical protein